jgi:acetyltransferase
VFDVLFSPKSVAVVGASANVTKWGNWITEQVLLNTEDKNVYLINRQRELIFNQRSLSSISEIPEKIDVAIVTVPLYVFETVIDELLNHGTKVIIGITTGFRETGNYDIENRIKSKISQAGSMLIGPNCAGVWSKKFQCLPIISPVSGSVGMISQSGGVIADLHERMTTSSGLGFSKIISIGNQTSLVPSMIDYLNLDQDTKVIAIYLEESINLPFIKLTKPLILLSPKITNASKRASLLHTGSKLGNINIADSVVASTLQEFALLIINNFQKEKKKIMIITDTGGLGVIAAGESEIKGFDLTDISTTDVQKIQEILNRSNNQINNPIDLIGISAGFSEKTYQIISLLADETSIDAFLIILFLTGQEDPKKEKEFAKKIAKLLTGKLAAFVCRHNNSPGIRVLRKNKILVYQNIETALEELKKLCG